LELGGTWVHPVQPNVWAEITRYGLDVEAMPEPGGTQAAVLGGRPVALDEAGVIRAFDGLAQFCALGPELFPAPYTASWGPDSKGYAQQTAREYLATLSLETALR